MSLDKFVMRGFTGSLGSGEGRWVASAQQPQPQSSQQSVVSHQGGTSFVMGGGPLRGRPSPKNDKSYKEDRYSFDAETVRSGGTMRSREEIRRAGEKMSLLETTNTKKGNQVVIAVVMYAIFLMLAITLLIVYFGDDNSSDYYSAPAGFSRKMKPMWER